ncbi:TatD family hydrolase [Patescibacteria group bacterium]|nr:TatD family hydrolase [Patescibacteria group bacterium]MBU1953212.1 TatD family hydrolase [Patescibacteria group bacterium]
MLIDSHCHLVHEKYKESIEEIIKDAKKFGVEKFIIVGTSIEENKKAIEASGKSEKIFCSVGIYPHENIEISLSDLKKSLEENLKSSKRVVAIGETGIEMPLWENGRTLDKQVELLEMHLNLALENKLPVIIHNRNGNEEVYALLKKYSEKGLSGVMHCFTSDWDYAQMILDLGFCISFTNIITYPKKEQLLEVVKNIPMDKFLLETDAPYLPPQSLRGEINYPKYVKIVAEKVAQVKQKTLDEVSECSYQNTCKLFKI